MGLKLYPVLLFFRDEEIFLKAKEPILRIIALLKFQFVVY